MRATFRKILRGCVACILIHTATASAATTHAPRTADRDTIALHVDVTDVDRRIFRVHETIPVKPGRLTLLYPQWLPGTHSPTGVIESLVGLTMTANGRRIAWRRDPLDMYAFHVDVGSGIAKLELEFQFVSPLSPEQGRVVVTPDIVGLQWERALLYPKGRDASHIFFSTSLTVPAGWNFGTALQTERRDADTIKFGTTSLETLVDSPLFAGRYFRRVDLDPGARSPVHLNVVADSADELDLGPEPLAAYRRFVQEADRLFGSRHFDRYDFLLAISDSFGSIGLEHLQSSEISARRGFFREWDRATTRRSVLPHEMVHSWNGKFHRPADLLTPDYNTRMQSSLLWVYEGLTTYWGQVLSARSAVWSQEAARDSLAALAASQQERRPGRAWRDLQDTTNQFVISSRRPQPWVSWQRSVDFYYEGLLLWLDVDARIRELSGNTRSLDDFAKAFFGANRGGDVPTTYAFDDVVEALNGVAPYDWATLLRTRLQSHESGALLDGIERAGWRLTYKDEPSSYGKELDRLNGTTDLSYSIGVVVDKDGKLTEVTWDSPAFKAGLSMDTTLVAVNTRAYRPELLKQVIQQARDHRSPIELLVRSGERYRTVMLDYAGGLRFPHLERIAERPDLLADIFKSRAQPQADGHE